MTPQAVVARLLDMRCVLRSMPHVNCEVVPGMEHGRCSCYKKDLLSALLDAETKVREHAGMEPF